MQLPTPQELQPLVDAAKNAVGRDVPIEVIMRLCNNPNQYWYAGVDDGAFKFGQPRPTGWAYGISPEEALSKFVAAFKPAPRISEALAAARAEVARLEALQ